MFTPTTPPSSDPLEVLEAADYQQRLATSRTIEFLRRARLTSLSGPGASAFLVYLVWDVADRRAIVLWWLALAVFDMISVLFASHGLNRLTSSGLDGPITLDPETEEITGSRIDFDPRRPSHIQVLTHGITGLIWGSAALWFVTDTSDSKMLFLVGVVLMAVSSVGSIGLMHYITAVTAFMGGIWLFPLLLMLGADDPQISKLGFGIIVLLLSFNFYLWEASSQLNRGIERRIRSDYLRALVQLKAAEVEKLANEDELTGTMTRRAGMAAIRELVAQAEKHSRPVSLVLADVDWFKSINDTYGHAAGDAVLAQIGVRIAGAIRQDDVVLRYGGEEFLIALSPADTAAATALTERVRHAVSNVVIDFPGGSITCTISAGVGRVTSVDAIDAALARIDAALYEAKNAGRNRAVVVGS